jgi:hypothetical protein
MSLHDSPFALKESEELEQLQERLRFLYDIINSMEDDEELDPDMSSDFFHTLYALIDKQLVLYTRLQLSSDEVDKLMMEELNINARQEGMRPDEDLYQYLMRRRKDVREKIIELTGEDLEKEVDLD